MAQYGNQWWASSGGSGFTEFTTSEFQAITSNTTYSTFTYDDSTYGDYLTLASPGGNTFRSANTTKQNGFAKHSYIQWQISGYGNCHFGIFQDGNAYNDATYLYDDVTNPSTYNYNQMITGNEWTFANNYFASGHNATSGQVKLYPAHAGTFGTTVTVTGVTAKYYGDSNPTNFRTGIDDDGNWYFEVYHSGGSSAPDHDGTGFTKVGPYYMVESTAQLVTDSTTSGLVNYGSNAFQFGWGNYDGGGVETMRRIKVRTNAE
mgnify:FL=1|tara:strand:+ start:480 stop:1262 length:783 start_codon:yes stop_codon:yes gene_type:complete